MAASQSHNSKVVEWQDDFGNWIPYDASVQTIINSSAISPHQPSSHQPSSPQSQHHQLQIKISRTKYVLDFVQNVQVNQKTGFQRSIRVRPNTLNFGHIPTINPIPPKPPLLFTDTNLTVNPTMNSQFLPVDFKILDAKETCVLCLEEFTSSDDIVIPAKCKGHFFHRKCPTSSTSIADYISKSGTCPVCKTEYATCEMGPMPPGTMTVVYLNSSLPGFDADSGTIQIMFNFPPGIQQHVHQNPFQPYAGDSRVAYLPNTPMGQYVLRLFRKAWDRKVLFTIGRSLSLDADNRIIYNGIHMKTVKTRVVGYPWGYPDDTYLDRVTDEFKQKGIVI